MGITALPLRLQPHHGEKFQEKRVTDVGETELEQKEIKTLVTYIDCRFY